jgi:O-succinylbenzoic acid--CoA ligase
MDDLGRECPTGELGEIWIGGPMVVPGYWNNESATRTAFAGGYWRSGDLGWIDANGYLRVVDRIKDMINRGGYKVFTIEVENVLYEHEGVLECAVVAVPCPVLGERVNAMVYTLQNGAALDDLKVRLGAHCAARLADYKVPERFVFTQQPLPRNANGKLLKRQIREALLGETVNPEGL